MRILDGKGRIFGKVNLLDAVIVGFVVFAGSFVLINMACGGKLSKKISDIPDFEYVVMKVILPEGSNWMAKHIKVGDIVQGSSFRGLTATVLNVEEVDGFGRGKRLMVEVKSFVAKDRQGVLSYGKQPLRIGEEIPFYTPKYIFYGQVTDIRATGEKIVLKD